MVPATILHNLARMRRRERALRLAWGAARWLALALALLAVCCLLDWVIDLERDTPFALRVTLLVLQIGVGVAALVVLVLRPVGRAPGDADLALQVEEAHPRLGHRLISAVQLNQAGAKTAGMSPVLIRAVTRESEEQSRSLDFPGVLDHRRLKWSAAVAGPLVALVVLLFALMPQTLPALLARQVLADVDVPRSVRLESVTREIQPGGDEVLLRFAVRGEKITDDLLGRVRLERPRQPNEMYTLAFDKWDGDVAHFTARVPPSSVDFEYRARLGDGRTRNRARVHYVPRPAVVSLEAWSLKPAYCGLRPNGERYADSMEKGDLALLPGCSARIVVVAQKPLRRAVLELLGSPAAGGAEDVVRRVEKPLPADTDRAEFTFDPDERVSAYRVWIEDEYEFRNAQPAQRTITRLPDELPRVEMLPDDRFADSVGKLFSENEVEGMPVVLGKPIRVAYRCRSPLGLKEAFLRLRVSPAKKNEDKEENEGEWLTIPLVEYRQTDQSGPFRIERGVFENSGPRDQIGFHRMPSPEPDVVQPYTQGGGRYDHETKALRNLKPGDEVEYYVEVYDLNPAPGRKPGVSTPPMVKRVVSLDEFEEWFGQLTQQERKLRELKEKQEKAAGKVDP